MPVSREELEARRTKIIYADKKKIKKSGSITAPTSGNSPSESFAITDGRSRRNARVTPVVKRLDPGFAATVSRVTARDGTGRAATLEPQPMVKKSESALRGVGHARLALRSLASDDSSFVLSAADRPVLYSSNVDSIYIWGGPSSALSLRYLILVPHV